MSATAVGFVCSATPLPLIRAAGLVPYRVLPLTLGEGAAGSLLHDNLCPHVKRALDRALDEDLPALAGMVVMASCDAMRRLADAWRVARPGDRLLEVELPVADGELAEARLADQLGQLRVALGRWSGHAVTDDDLRAAGAAHDVLAGQLAALEERAVQGRLKGGWAHLQELRNLAVTRPYEEALGAIAAVRVRTTCDPAAGAGVPVLLSGNVLPEPEALALFAACGASLVADDLCTGSRQLLPVNLGEEDDPIISLARSLLRRPPCARSMCDGRPGSFADHVVARALACGARGVVLHIMKFCDPYLARLPVVRDRLRDAGLPVLVLEGDCSLRSLGQQRTRIAAFVEMLEEGS